LPVTPTLSAWTDAPYLSGMFRPPTRAPAHSEWPAEHGDGNHSIRPPFKVCPVTGMSPICMNSQPSRASSLNRCRMDSDGSSTSRSCVAPFVPAFSTRIESDSVLAVTTGEVVPGGVAWGLFGPVAVHRAASIPPRITESTDCRRTRRVCLLMSLCVSFRASRRGRARIVPIDVLICGDCFYGVDICLGPGVCVCGPP